MREELKQLREEMYKQSIDMYIIPTTDFHGSEYVNDYFKAREYVSGFTGSAGTLIVSQNEAALWTDGRYFIQAASQLNGSSIELMKMGEPGVPTENEYLYEHMNFGQTLGFDGRVINWNRGNELWETLEDKNITIADDLDLVNNIWEHRPDIKPASIYSIPLEVTGKSSAIKLQEVRTKMESKGADYLLLTNLEEIAWLLNLRGGDVANTPVFFSFGLISHNNAIVYLYESALKKGLIGEEYTVKNYGALKDDMRLLRDGSVLWINGTQAAYGYVSQVSSKVKLIDEPSPIQLFKAIKNEQEIRSTRNAHLRDGVAMVEFIYWLKHHVTCEYITEISAADYLEECRRKQAGFKDLSFTTISGYNHHGAIVHYDPTEATNIPLKAEGLLLVDSGGQYEDGTTDITTTIALGALSENMKSCYTSVLAAHIELACAKFGAGTTGLDLDIIARKPLRAKGLDFNHGTGHGVGHLLSVHEPPNNISPRGNACEIVPGMITSNEPGVYIEGEFGIRLENEIVCVEHEDMYQFETITLCPFDREAIIASELTLEQREWLNNYHEWVYNTLSPFLHGDVVKWLRVATERI